MACLYHRISDCCLFCTCWYLWDFFFYFFFSFFSSFLYICCSFRFLENKPFQLFLYIQFFFIYFFSLFIYIRGGYTLTLLPMRDEIAKYQKIRMKSGTKGKWKRSFHHHITKSMQQQKNEKKNLNLSHGIYLLCIC